MKEVCRKKKMSIWTALAITITAVGLLIGPFLSSVIAKDYVYRVRLATSKEGSGAYSSGVGMCACVKKYTDIFMEAVPTPGSTASVKIFASGNVDTAYASTWTLRDAYNDTGPFAERSIRDKRLPLQGWYYVPIAYCVITTPKSGINSLHDLAGRRVFPNIAGGGVYDVYKEILTKMGIWDKMEKRQMGFMEAPDALKLGTIEAICAYTVCKGLVGPSWMKNLDNRMDLKIIVPTQEEKEFIRKMSGLTCGRNFNKWMKPENQARNSGELWGWSFGYGFHPGADMPTEVMYKIYKAWIEHAKGDLAATNSLLKIYAEDPIRNQIEAISEIPEIPIHPGVAKYLKEKGLWKPSWIVGKLDPGVE